MAVIGAADEDKVSKPYRAAGEDLSWLDLHGEWNNPFLTRWLPAKIQYSVPKRSFACSVVQECLTHIQAWLARRTRYAWTPLCDWKR